MNPADLETIKYCLATLLHQPGVVFANRRIRLEKKINIIYVQKCTIRVYGTRE